MDRVIVWPSAIPLDLDVLNTNRNTMIALGYLAQMVLGTSTVADGLTCTPTSPATMTVNVGQGQLLSLQTIDSTGYGSLSSDSDPLVKVGINAFGVTNFSTPAPSGAGNSVNYLIEAAFSETDGGSVVLPYYNASNPSQPYSGPGNAGTPNYTARQQKVTLTLKAGSPAPTGTQTTPSVDSNNVGLWVITVANGASSVTSGNIAQCVGAPFIPAKLGVGSLFGPMRTQVLATAGSGTWTVPNGVTAIEAHAWGAGGGGSGGSGGAGGGGGYARKLISVTPGQVISYTVGAGGAGASSAAAAGTGGTTTFGPISASGGIGGGPGEGIGGTGSGGDVNLTGQAGIDIDANSTYALGTQGTATGGDAAGGGGFGGNINASGAGSLPTQPGGGGGANAAVAAGQAGADGMIEIRW